MTMVKEILQQMPAVSKPQAKFLETLFATILALRATSLSQSESLLRLL